jgi:carbamoyl-phosphate synthase large subunit
VGLMNIQFAIAAETVYVLEVNPRASRTVPFVSKATGVPLAKIAAKLMVGRKLSEFNLPDELDVRRFYIKTPVFPFVKFPGVDPVLGPEMRSTGEVMGVAESFGAAFLKAQQGAGTLLPREGAVFISVNDGDKREIVDLARKLHDMGFKLVATRGTQRKIEGAGLPCGFVYKVNEGRPNVTDLVRSEQIDLIINTPLGRVSFYDERSIRRAAMQYSVPCVTTMTGAVATVAAIRALREEEMTVRSLQEYHAQGALK